MANLVWLWKENLSKEHKPQIELLKVSYPKKKTLTININATSEELFNEIVKDPLLAENALYSALMEGRMIPGWNGSKHSINLRFIGFPNRISVKDLNSSYLEKFTSLRVIVRKVTTVKPRLVHAAFKCNACKDKTVYVPVEEEEVIPPHDKCLCGGKSWRFMLKQSIKKDFQIIHVQDPPEDGSGTKPEILTVKLLDDLTGQVQPGNIIVINGVFRGHQKKNGATLDTYMDAKSVEVKNKDFSKIEITPEEVTEFEAFAKDPAIFDNLWQSIGGVVKGYEAVKQAMLLQLLGGVEKTTDDGDRFRADFHILLCGDPSVAKSKLLKSAFNMCPRGIYASGKATSAAGLTAAATKGTDGAWEIEAGAAVLADKGNLFLDELDKIDKDAVSALHEIAEEQVLHINKAGINADLSTKCAILAAANPKRSRFDKFQDLGSQVTFAPSLLSRFGLIFLLTDEPDAKNDRAIAKHIINAHRGKTAEKKIPIEKVRKFIAHAKQSCTPEISDEAAQMYEDYYAKIRGKAQSAIPITPRQIEDIIRMSEASAKTRLSESVQPIDVNRAIWIYEEAMRFTGTDPKTGELDTDKASGLFSFTNRDGMTKIKELRMKEFTDTGKWPDKSRLTDMAIYDAGIENTEAVSLVNALWKEMNLSGRY
jgi:replicative DNA helicase Mcm